MKRSWLRRFLPSTYRLVVICVIIGVFGAGAALAFDSLGPELVVPRGLTRLQAGDQLIAIADPAAYGEIQALAGASPAG